MVGLKICNVHRFVISSLQLIVFLSFFLNVSLSHVPANLFCIDHGCSASITHGSFIVDHEDLGIPKDTNIEIIGKSAETTSTSALIRVNDRFIVVDSSYFIEFGVTSPANLVRVKTDDLPINHAIRQYQTQSYSQKQAHSSHPPVPHTPKQSEIDLPSLVKNGKSNKEVAKTSSIKVDTPDAEPSRRHIIDKKTVSSVSTPVDKPNSKGMVKLPRAQLSENSMANEQVGRNYSSNFSSLTPAEDLPNKSENVEFSFTTPNRSSTGESFEANQNSSISLDERSTEKPQQEKALPNTVDSSSQFESKVINKNVNETNANQKRIDINAPSSVTLPSNTSTVNFDDKPDQVYRETDNDVHVYEENKFENIRVPTGPYNGDNQSHTTHDESSNKSESNFSSSDDDTNITDSVHFSLNETGESNKIDTQKQDLPNPIDSENLIDKQDTHSGYVSTAANKKNTDLNISNDLSRSAYETEGIAEESNSFSTHSIEEASVNDITELPEGLSILSLHDSNLLAEQLDKTSSSTNVQRTSDLNDTLHNQIGLIQCIAMAASATTNHGEPIEKNPTSPVSQLLIYVVRYFMSSADAFIKYLPHSLAVHFDYFLVGTLSLPLNFLVAWTLFVTQAVAFYFILRLFLLLINRSTVWLLWKSSANENSDSSEQLLISAERVEQLSSQLTDQEAINGRLSCWTAELLLKLQSMETKMSSRDECLSSTRNDLVVVSEKLQAMEQKNDKLLHDCQDLEEVFVNCKIEFMKEKAMLEDSYDLKLTELQKEHAMVIEDAKKEHGELFRQSMEYYEQMKAMQSELQQMIQLRKEAEEKLIATEANFNNLSATFSTLKSFEITLGQVPESGTCNDDYTLVSTSTDRVTETNNDSETDSQSELVRDDDVNDSPNQPKSKIYASLALFLDIGQLRVELESANNQLRIAGTKINDEQMLRTQLETQLEQARRECTELNVEIDRLNDERVSVQTKLDVLSEYFKEREVELRHDLGKHLLVGSESTEALNMMRNRTKELEVELKTSRELLTSLRRELAETKLVSRRQISELNKQTHDRWLSSQSADKTVKELREDNAALRKKLVEAQHTLIRPALRQQQMQMNHHLRNPHLKPRPGGPTISVHNSANSSPRSSTNIASGVTGSSRLSGSDGRLPFARMPVGGILPPPFILPPPPFLPGFPPGLLPPNLQGTQKDHGTGSTSSHSHPPDRSSMS